MDGLLDLNLVSTSHRPKEQTILEEVRPSKTSEEPILLSTANSPEEALEILKHEPGYDALASVLRFLSQDQPGSTAFDITRPSPQSAQIVQVLVSEIVPNYWTLLKEDSANNEQGRRGKLFDLDLLVRCLRSITGVNAALVHLRSLIQEAKSEGKEVKTRSHASLNIAVILDLLCSILEQESSLQEIWRSATVLTGSDGKRKPLSQEILGIFGGGRLLSVAAEAEQIVQQRGGKTHNQRFWVASAYDYTTWLGRNIARSMVEEPSQEETKFLSGLFFKAIRLGHSDILIELILQKLLLQQSSKPALFGTLIENMLPIEQRKVLFVVLKILSDSYLNRFGSCESQKSSEVIASVAGAVQSIVGTSSTKREHLVTWLTGSSGAGLGDGIGIRRAVLAVICQDRETLALVAEKSMNQFGDQLYIKHSPVIQQEAHAQVLLLAAGYARRMSPSTLTMLMSSSTWLNAVSNRLAATHQRARYLGMVVGEALSTLVHKGDKKLDFHMEETNCEEAKWYKSLTQITDQIGSIKSLFQPEAKQPNPSKEPTSQSTLKQRVPLQPAGRPARQPPKQGFIIEEVEDSDDELVPYAEPDSDAEDSDDDPTMIQRNKPKAPVYIRDLIRYLRDVESYDHQKLALTTAPTLIRRKANYGMEVSEHAEELASLLIGLQDKFDIEDFYDLRLQGLIAIVVAQSKTMALWFARTFFDGDYSVSQRAAILITLGLSAREIAGLETSGYAQAAAFPSQTLPEQVERLYLGPSASSHQSSSSALKALPPNALDNIANSLTSTFMAPMIASAADKASGPDALKLTTFTSRLNESKVKRKSRTKPRVRAIPNTTAQIISASFFMPLTARFQAALQSSASRTRGILFQPYLLALYLKTLGVLLHAAGPSTLALPDMTAELWTVLLSSSVRTQCIGDLGVTRAAMFVLLVLLEVNDDRMRDICQDMGREVVETQEWVASVFGGIRGGDGEDGEENETKGLAAAVLVRLKEGIDKYQMLLVGDLIS